MMRKNASTRVPARTTLLLLVFAVAGLSTLAKYSQHVPNSNPIHFFSKTTKMNVTHLPVVFVAVPNAPVVKVVLHRPAFRMLRPIFCEKIDLLQIGLTISLQHRSPPFSFV
jgi:hypothetical protein